MKKKDIFKGKIVARASITLWSWGEIISFSLSQINNQETLVEVSSKPLVPPTVFDYGKNLENVEKITQFLKQRTQLRTPSFEGSKSRVVIVSPRVW